MSRRRIGVLDVGTNTVKALAVEARDGDLHLLADRSWGTRLGEGLAENAALSEAGVRKTLRAVGAARRVFDALKVAARRAVATSAAREASNGAEFARRFREAAGFDLRILSGAEEADLVFFGAMGDLREPPRSGEAVVMNSGGGSAEWARGTAKRVTRRASLPLGCVRMTERFLRGDPYTKASLRRIEEFYEDALAPVAREFSPGKAPFLGSGGSLCAIAAIAAGEARFRAEAVHGRTLTRGEVEAVAERLARMTAAERRRIPSLPRQRADIVTAGALLFAAAMRALNAERIVVSVRGLRYGVLREALGSTTRTRRR